MHMSEKEWAQLAGMRGLDPRTGKRSEPEEPILSLWDVKQQQLRENPPTLLERIGDTWRREPTSTPTSRLDNYWTSAAIISNCYALGLFWLLIICFA